MKNKTICLMVPTYKRIPRLMSFVNSAIDMANDVNNLRFSFCVNIKDEETIDFLHAYPWPNTDHYEVILEETRQPNLALYFNKMYEETKFTDSIVTELGDDMVFMTKGWDSRVLQIIEVSNGYGIVYCNDNYVAQEKCCVNMFITRQLVEITKKPFMCKAFHADMIDQVWTMVGMMTGLLRYQADIIIQHNHATKEDKDKWDETFQRLAPIQNIARSKDNQKYCLSYASLCAKNIIDHGVGTWNTLS